MAPLRSLLFVPATRPDRFMKAVRSGADGIILDLEDAVLPEDKMQARQHARRFLEAYQDSVPLLVRINDATTSWFEEDARLATLSACQGVLLPKAESSSHIQQLTRFGKPVYPIIETACGMGDIRELSGQPGVQALVFGSIDFCADTRVAEDSTTLLAFRSEMVLASRIAGIQPPVDGVTTDIDDTAPLLAATTHARQMGFAGKLCIHPAQIPTVNHAFLPTEKEIRRAEAIVRMAETHPQGAFRLNGEMVDKPVILQARQLIAGLSQA